MKGLGHEIDENGITLIEEKVEAILKFKRPENTKKTKVISRCNTIHGKISTEAFGTNRPIEETAQKTNRGIVDRSKKRVSIEQNKC